MKTKMTQMILTCGLMRTMTKDEAQIYDYFEKAFNAIPEDHPHYSEVRRLLIAQINDQLRDLNETHSATDRRAS